LKTGAISSHILQNTGPIETLETGKHNMQRNASHLSDIQKGPRKTFEESPAVSYEDHGEETYLDLQGSIGLHPDYKISYNLVDNENAVASCALLKLAAQASTHQSLSYRHPKTRRRLSREAVAALERTFSLNPRPDARTISLLARGLNEDDARIRIWFNNRRGKEQRLKKPEILTSEPVGKKVKMRPVDHVDTLSVISTGSDCPLDPSKIISDGSHVAGHHLSVENSHFTEHPEVIQKGHISSSKCLLRITNRLDALITYWMQFDRLLSLEMPSTRGMDKQACDSSHNRTYLLTRILGLD
jgi:hypothetical protein